MKNKGAFVGFVCILFVLLGLIFAAYYFDVYIRNIRHAIYLFFALLAVAESLFAGLSFYFLIFARNKSKFAIITYIISVVLAMPVLLMAIFWILYFAGVQIVPLPQR